MNRTLNTCTPLEFNVMQRITVQKLVPTPHPPVFFPATVAAEAFGWLAVVSRKGTSISWRLRSLEKILHRPVAVSKPSSAVASGGLATTMLPLSPLPRHKSSVASIRLVIERLVLSVDHEFNKMALFMGSTAASLSRNVSLFKGG
ncbi:hypothetical protein AXF42_Ash018970 [Apostasia shenzhenica]|uniref:Uncharacterized protein n=1 Tax=Apostasia shenzhenica TaxID=1088818 RepID=A0A2I0ABY5_9ASPA|nr:hypothetical protein AXF42_Ash018970 [Apostasia shenzhenica]